VPDTRFANVPPRYNAAPSQELWADRQNHDTGERSLDLLRWGLIPYWSKAKPKPAPINAKAETVARLPMFRDAYRRRRCISNSSIPRSFGSMMNCLPGSSTTRPRGRPSRSANFQASQLARVTAMSMGASVSHDPQQLWARASGGKLSGEAVV
jgi:hypothetical protein